MTAMRMSTFSMGFIGRGSVERLREYAIERSIERFDMAINRASIQYGDQHGDQYGNQYGDQWRLIEWSIERRRGGADVVMQKVSAINIPYGQNYSGKWYGAHSPPALTTFKCDGERWRPWDSLIDPLLVWNHLSIILADLANRRIAISSSVSMSCFQAVIGSLIRTTSTSLRIRKEGCVLDSAHIFRWKKHQMEG